MGEARSVRETPCALGWVASRAPVMGLARPQPAGGAGDQSADSGGTARASMAAWDKLPTGAVRCVTKPAAKAHCPPACLLAASPGAL